MRYKDDKRPQRLGWAPGSYLCKCANCPDTFIGDKRSMMCADCAYALPDPAPSKQKWGSPINVEEFYIGQNTFAKVERGVVHLRKKDSDQKVSFDTGGLHILFHTVDAAHGSNEGKPCTQS